MKKTSFLFMLLIVVSGLSCSREAAPGSVEAVFEGLSKAANFNESKKFYTDGTVEVIEEAASRDGVPVSSIGGVLPPFVKGARWSVSTGEIKGNNTVAAVTFTGHPVQNLVGFTYTFRMVKSDGGWKIDLEKEISEMVSGRSRNGAADYLRKIGRSQ